MIWELNKKRKYFNTLPKNNHFQFRDPTKDIDSFNTPKFIGFQIKGIVITNEGKKFNREDQTTYIRWCLNLKKAKDRTPKDFMSSNKKDSGQKVDFEKELNE